MINTTGKFQLVLALTVLPALLAACASEDAQSGSAEGTAGTAGRGTARSVGGKAGQSELPPNPLAEVATAGSGSSGGPSQQQGVGGSTATAGTTGGRVEGIEATTTGGQTGEPPPKVPASKVDDWVFSPAPMSNAASTAGSFAFAGSPTLAVAAAPAGVGLAVGGSQDAQNFRENIANGYLPRVKDITPEGVFHSYFFDRGQDEPCTALLCPTYSQMLSSDILTDGKDYFLSVGLTSGMTEADVKRKKLNLVVVLDISGSMGSSFSSYYYDSFGNKVTTESASTESKLTLASKSIVGMLDRLREGDRFGMVLFDDAAYLAKPMAAVEATDMEAIKQHILELGPQGSTNMESGYKQGTSLYQRFQDADPAEYENRIVFLTDAMPNTGNITAESLLGLTETNAAARLYTTFIGIGVDFNTNLIETLTKVRGANYFSVHSDKEFKTRMDDEFDYMVTPLVFDLALNFRSEGFAIDKVYGSPEADRSTGTLMRVNTLFPSKTEGGATKGGVVLLKLKRTGDSSAISLSAAYEDRAGQKFSTDKVINFEAALDVAPNTGIRKAILLSRYVDLMQSWITTQRSASGATPDSASWEQTSVPLSITAAQQAEMQTFLTAFARERAALGDDTLTAEEDILKALMARAPATP